MADTTRESDAILRDAGRSLAVQQDGGYHRRAGSKSIGKGSSDFKNRHYLRKFRNIFFALVGVLIAASVAGLILDGIGFAGVLLTVLAMIVALYVFARYPKLKMPKRADLNRGTVKQMVTRTELWLENQRPALPPPAVRIVDDIGVQLDALGLQLEHIDPAHPAAMQTRKLVGEYLPEMIDSYRKIPANLRKEERAGATPDDQLADSLRKISGEIDQVTRQLADGALDDLAIRNRFLDYKFGGQLEDQPATPSTENI